METSPGNDAERQLNDAMTEASEHLRADLESDIFEDIRSCNNDDNGTPVPESPIIREELLTIVDHLNEYELRPLLFKARRLLRGQEKYGPNFVGKRDWLLEMAEEADDLVNYWVWGDADEEG
jgi:hypothetical protein